MNMQFTATILMTLTDSRANQDRRGHGQKHWFQFLLGEESIELYIVGQFCSKIHVKIILKLRAGTEI